MTARPNQQQYPHSHHQLPQPKIPASPKPLIPSFVDDDDANDDGDDVGHVQPLGRDLSSLSTRSASSLDSSDTQSMGSLDLHPAASIPDEGDGRGSDASSFYDLSIKKGRGLIIVNTKFEGDYFSDRKVNHNYIRQVQSLLEERKVTCDVHWNQTAAQMLKIIEDFSTQGLTSKESLAFVIVVSHGAFGTVFGTDGVPVPIMQVTERFSKTVRPWLSHIPKIFVLQSCQAFQDYKDTMAGSHSLRQEEVIPLKENNFHVEYTTLPGGFDFDLSKSGSIYFYHFNKALEKYSAKRSLLDIMQHTRKKLLQQRIPYQGAEYEMCSLSLSTLKVPVYLSKDIPNTGRSLSVPERREKTATTERSASLDTASPNVPTSLTRVFCPEDHAFYHGYFKDSKEVKDMIEPYRNTPGHYLLRPSFTEREKYTFAITHTRRRLLYLKLQVKGLANTLSFSLADRRFSSLQKLVEYYEKHPIPNDERLSDGVFLLNPVERKFF